jgi:hypothetical protein
MQDGTIYLFFDFLPLLLNNFKESRALILFLMFAQIIDRFVYKGIVKIGFEAMFNIQFLAFDL